MVWRSRRTGNDRAAWLRIADAIWINYDGSKRGGSIFLEPQDQRVTVCSGSWPPIQSHRMTGFRAVREP